MRLHKLLVNTCETLKIVYTLIHCVCVCVLKSNIDYVYISIGGILIVSNKEVIVFMSYSCVPTAETFSTYMYSLKIDVEW